MRTAGFDRIATMNVGSRSVKANSLDYDDIIYAIDGAAAVITINRPHRYNAFTAKTVEELIKAFRAAWADTRVSAVIQRRHRPPGGAEKYGDVGGGDLRRHRRG